jgi:hypothetical protein
MGDARTSAAIWRKLMTVSAELAGGLQPSADQLSFTPKMVGFSLATKLINRVDCSPYGFARRRERLFGLLSRSGNL